MSALRPLAAEDWAQAPRRVLIALLRGYRLLLSPTLGNQCRFAPTCSVYGMEALHRHGALLPFWADRWSSEPSRTAFSGSAQLTISAVNQTAHWW